MPTGNQLPRFEIQKYLDEDIQGETLVEFRLSYGSRVLSASRNDTRATLKHGIRRKFHPPLKRLSETNDNLGSLIHETGFQKVGMGLLKTLKHSDNPTGLNQLPGCEDGTMEADQILYGAYCAMDQAGRLITDAASLYHQRSWPSSLVLAVFSFEELGKAEALYKRALDAHRTGPKTAEEVMRGQNHHVTKLREGRDLLTVHAFVGYWGEEPDPDSPEGKEILGQLRESQNVALENAPHEAHQARMRSLYVDLEEGERWISPRDTSPSDAYLMVSAAAIQYGEYRKKFVRPDCVFVTETLRARAFLLPPEAPKIGWPR